MIIAAVKIIISMAWFITIGLNTTMGVAWHRFTAWPNIWFKRESSGEPALGAVPPIMIDSKPLDFAAIEELDEDTSLGVGKVEDFTWKGCWTSPRAPSAGAVSHSARPGTPASPSHPNY